MRSPSSCTRTCGPSAPGELPCEQRRQPVAAKKVPHGRAGTGADEELVVLCLHGVRSFAKGRSLRSAIRNVVPFYGVEGSIALPFGSNAMTDTPSLLDQIGRASCRERV